MTVFNCYGAQVIIINSALQYLTNSNISTEAGGLSMYLPKTPGKDWAYFKVADLIPYEFVPRGDGVYELIVFVSHHLTL